MINYTNEKCLDDLAEIAETVKSIKKNHDIGILSIVINPGFFLIGRRNKISLSFTTSPKINETTNYETYWDSLIFAIMGADAKADIMDAVDAERMTTAAIAAVKKLASERDENQRVAEAFQTASLENSTLHRYYHNGAHVGNIRYPAEVSAIFNAEMVSKLKGNIERVRSIGHFQEIYVNVPSGHVEIAFDPSAELTKAIKDSARNYYLKLVKSEISDLFASLCQPGSPDIQDGWLLQAELMKRIQEIFECEVQP